MPQIERSARVIFGDASITIQEPHPGRRSWSEEKAWERQFREDVLKRVAQLMRRLGWTCVMPEVNQRDKQRWGGNIAENSARNKRICQKGELKGLVELSGASIELEMFQNVNAPNHPDHDGRYEFNKEAIMPYLLRLEMERTRRRIRDYLCNVFTGYRFDTEWMHKHDRKVGPGHMTAMEYALKDIRNSGHYREELGRASFNGDAEKSGDGGLIKHGGQVFAINGDRRVITGTALYCLNGNWKIISGKYGITYNVWHKQVFVNNPGDLRRKRNDDLRRKRLEGQLNIAIGAMNFERAGVLRDILYPPGEQIFCLWHREHQAYHRAGFSGYTKDQMQAGKFTRAELEGWSDERNAIVPFGKTP